MTHQMSIFGLHNRVAQLKPPAQLLRRVFDWTRPAATGHRSLHVSKARVATQNQKIYSRSFRNRELKVALVRIPNDDIADNRPVCVAIEKLAGSQLPITFRLRELMRRRGRATRKIDNQQYDGDCGEDSSHDAGFGTMLNRGTIVK